MTLQRRRTADSEQATERRAALGRLTLLWAILALLGQSLAVQTHRHSDEMSLRPGYSAGWISTAKQHGSDHSPLGCPLCQEMAQAGAYLPAAPPALPLPKPAFPAPAATVATASVSPGRSHAWRSRGPPSAATRA